jgi:16S rRNA (cytosine1402-N4)-methyltransferase
LKYQPFYENRKIKWKKIENYMNATMSLEKNKHYPVMLNQVLSIISPQRGGTFIDCTFGGGGYSKAILKFPNTKVIALDRDKLIQEHATDLEKQYPKRFSFFKKKFSNLNQIASQDVNPQAIIFDLGLSFFQLNDKKRGFSFNSKDFLNMEMGINENSAYNVVNNFDKEALTNIIKIFGDEKDGKKIANKIDRYRKVKPIQSSYELSKIVAEVKKNFNSHKKNPATKTFQAIRIFVNKELTELILGLIAATKLLSNGGVLVVVSFHSLEDKIVKNFLNFYSNLTKNPSRYMPTKENKSSLFKILSKKPIVPSDKEIKENASSRSAKLRYGIRNENNIFNSQEVLKKFENYFKLEKVKI